MCARYSIGFTEKQVRDLFNLEPEGLEVRYNVAPTQDVPGVVMEAGTHKKHLEHFRWGLVPSWAKDLKIGQKLINARSETIGVCVFRSSENRQTQAGASREFQP
jgi:putative SOS response-associated peptidase YedK